MGEKRKHKRKHWAVIRPPDPEQRWRWDFEKTYWETREERVNRIGRDFGDYVRELGQVLNQPRIVTAG